MPLHREEEALRRKARLHLPFDATRREDRLRAPSAQDPADGRARALGRTKGAAARACGSGRRCQGHVGRGRHLRDALGRTRVPLPEGARADAVVGGARDAASTCRRHSGMDAAAVGCAGHGRYLPDARGRGHRRRGPAGTAGCVEKGRPGLGKEYFGLFINFVHKEELCQTGP